MRHTSFALSSIIACSLGMFSIASHSVLANSALPSIVSLLLDEKALSPLKINKVYFAQTHVKASDEPYFGLVSNRAALLKVQITGPSKAINPPPAATLSLNGREITLPLDGPSNPPRTFESDLGKVQHTFANSYTAMIPKDWLQPNLTVSIAAGDQTQELSDITIGAPTEVPITMFDTHFFQFNEGDYASGWKQEIESKWPVAKLSVERVPAVVFNELVVPPRANIGPVKVDSQQSYTDQTGLKFDGEQAAARQWNSALKRAAGTAGRVSLYYTNIYGVRAGGQAGGFAGVGGARSLGILHHELGHALSLPHWGNTNRYPYKGDMHGISAPDSFRSTHAGPIWAYDAPSNTFIPPTRQENSVAHPSVPRGTYKKEPMQGGGTGDQEEGFLMRHFSDFSVNEMRNYLEGHVVKWSNEFNSYVSWDRQTKSYSKQVTNDGFQFAIQRNQPVISVMAAVSASAPEINMIYPPIGPYKSGLISLLDPSNLEDRITGQNSFCPENGCDVSFKITQGDKIKHIMLPVSWQNDIAVSDWRSMNTTAVNLPVDDGAVIKVELLLSPDAEINGLPNDPTVLAVWEN